MIIHKQSKHKKSFTVCGLKKILFPNAVTNDWEKVTCENCKKVMLSNEVAFSKYKYKCRHHTYSKVVSYEKISYHDYCTFSGLDNCSKRSCKILNGENK